MRSTDPDRCRTLLKHYKLSLFQESLTWGTSLTDEMYDMVNLVIQPSIILCNFVSLATPDMMILDEMSHHL